MLPQLIIAIATLALTIQFVSPLELSKLNRQNVFFSSTESITLRLHPHQDIMQAITILLKPYQITALSVSSAVGSVHSCWIRFANNSFLSHVQGPFEITSLVGTIDRHLQPHIHIQLANGDGTSLGGHLPSLEERSGSGEQFGCPIYTTLELVLLWHKELIYERKIDPQTTFHELYISRRHLA